jgi:hypothetical protein
MCKHVQDHPVLKTKPSFVFAYLKIAGARDAGDRCETTSGPRLAWFAACAACLRLLQQDEHSLEPGRQTFGLPGRVLGRQRSARGLRHDDTLATAFVLQGVVIVPQQTAWVIETFGRYDKVLQPGLRLLIPFVQRISYVFSLKEEAISVPSQVSFCLPPQCQLCFVRSDPGVPLRRTDCHHTRQRECLDRRCALCEGASILSVAACLAPCRMRGGVIAGVECVAADAASTSCSLHR